jgi:hypothetical protein
MRGAVSGLAEESPGLAPAIIAVESCVYRKPYPRLLSEESAKLAR